MLFKLRRRPRSWWCLACLRDVREAVCPGCGYSRSDGRARCTGCGVVGRLTSGTCRACGARLRTRGPVAAFPLPSPTAATVVVDGVLVEDRTPASPPPAEGAVFAPVPRQLPWFDILSLVMLLGSLASLLWLTLGWPGWLVLLIFLAPLAVLGLMRRLRPERFEALRQRAAPLLAALAQRLPEIRRIVVQTADGRLVGVELPHPSAWPPAGARPNDGPLRIRCEGAWVQPDRLLRADRLAILDDEDNLAAVPVRARAWQTFPVALGITALIVLVMTLVQAAGR